MCREQRIYHPYHKKYVSILEDEEEQMVIVNFLAFISFPLTEYLYFTIFRMNQIVDKLIDFEVDSLMSNQGKSFSLL